MPPERMKMKIDVQGPLTGQSSICEPILRSLPNWFGIEESNRRYIRDTDRMPTFVSLIDNEAAGFLTIKIHNQYSAEIQVLGVRPEKHRQGLGRAMLVRAEEYLRGEGVEFLQVKTLSPSRPDEGYDKTRAFYQAMGFRPLEEFPDMWDKNNPCLQMIKALSR